MQQELNHMQLSEESCFLLSHIFLTKMIRGYHNLSFKTSFVEIDLLNIYVIRQNRAAEPMWYDSCCISNFNSVIMVVYLQYIYLGTFSGSILTKCYLAIKLF